MQAGVISTPIRGWVTRSWSRIVRGAFGGRFVSVSWKAENVVAPYGHYILCPDDQEVIPPLGPDLSGAMETHALRASRAIVISRIF